MRQVLSKVLENVARSRPIAVAVRIYQALLYAWIVVRRHLILVLKLIYLHRCPLVLSVILYVVLSAPPQIREIYSLYFQVWASDKPTALIYLARDVALLTCAVIALNAAFALIDRDVIATRHAALGVTARWHRLGLQIVCSVLPALGMVQGMRGATYSLARPELGSAYDELDRLEKADAEAIRALIPQQIMELGKQGDTPPILLLLLVAVLAIPLAVVFFYHRDGGIRWPSSRLLAFFSRHPILMPVIVFTALALIQSIPVRCWLDNIADPAACHSGLTNAIATLPSVVGTIGLVLGFFAVATIALTSALAHYDRFEVPVFAFAVALLVLFNVYSLNDNHEVRVFSTAPTSPPIVDLEEGFRKWLTARRAWYDAPERSPAINGKFKDVPYPVFVVAAPGGGIYAASYAAISLARLYDICPRMRQHVFAISSVSGGSLGAAAFVSALADEELTYHDKPKPDPEACGMSGPGDGAPGPLETIVRDYLLSDFLSPVSAGVLTGDLLQLFWPWPIQSFDRAKVFEHSLESRWHAMRKRRLKTDEPTTPDRRIINGTLAGYWRPKGELPLMMMNTTLVESGTPIIIAPVKERSLRLLNARFETVYDEFLKTAQNIRVSSAVSLSARFPGMLPAGNIDSDDKMLKRVIRQRLVDGGYFDNSGVGSARALMTVIDGAITVNKTKASKQPIHSSLLIMGDAGADSADRSRYSEVGTPVAAFFASWRARANAETWSAFEELDPSIKKSCFRNPLHPQQIESCRPLVSILNNTLIQLPLGWQLSDNAIRTIAAQVGRPGGCLFEADFKDNIERRLTQGEIKNIDARLNLLGLASRLIRNSCTSFSLVQRLRAQ